MLSSPTDTPTRLDSTSTPDSVLREVFAHGAVATASGAETPIFPTGLKEPRAAALRRIVARERPLRTIETGCGLGISGLCIAAGVDDHLGRSAMERDGVSHVAVDPVQTAAEWMDSAALLVFERAGIRERVRLIEKRSEVALPELWTGGERYDFAFVDGAHWFENVFIDLVFLARMVEPGGLIVVDDTWMPAIRTAVSYAAGNLNLARETAEGEGEDRFALLRVLEVDPSRPWDHFVPFDVARDDGRS